MRPTVDGLDAAGFEEVRAEFERNFAERGEISQTLLPTRVTLSSAISMRSLSAGRSFAGAINRRSPGTVAGAMAHTTYGPILRWIVRRASKPLGGPTDTSRDYEYTDWADVERFAKCFVTMIPVGTATVGDTSSAA